MAIVVDPDTDPEVIASHFEQHGTLVGVTLSEGATRDELERIARAHAALDHGECVLDLVVVHPNADDSLLQAVLDLAPDSSQVANSVATSPRVTEAILDRLSSSTLFGVRDHVTMARLEHELARIEPDAFADVLERFADHDTLGYGVRYRLATHPRTPDAVLETIAAIADATGEAARKRLGR